VGTFFTGSNFILNDYNLVTWTHPLRGLEAAFSLFNLSLGLFLVFNARTLGALYLINNIDFKSVPELDYRLRKACFASFTWSLPFLLYVLLSLLVMSGFGLDEGGMIAMIKRKYLGNLLAQPWILLLLLAGVVLVVLGVLRCTKMMKNSGIWMAGPGTVLVGLAVFFTAGYNNTAFYPSKADLQSSLTIFNASSSHYPLTVMTYVAFAIPFVLAYIAYVWHAMDKKKLGTDELGGEAY